MPDNAAPAGDGVRDRRRADRFIGLAEALIDQAPVGLLVLDTELRMVEVNPAMAVLNGRLRTELLGRSVRELLASDSLIEPILREVLKTGQPRLNVELQGTPPATPDEERTWLASYLSAARSRPGAGRRRLPRAGHHRAHPGRAAGPGGRGPAGAARPGQRGARRVAGRRRHPSGAGRPHRARLRRPGRARPRGRLRLAAQALDRHRQDRQLPAPARPRAGGPLPVRSPGPAGAGRPPQPAGAVAGRDGEGGPLP